MTFITKDSGQREEFETGAVRDSQDDKPHYALIDMLFLERVAGVLTRGAKKYQKNNWRVGVRLSRHIESLERHLQQAKAGDKSEDHIAAIAVNAMFWMWTEAAIEAGKLPASLDDLDEYLGRLTASEPAQDLENFWEKGPR